MENIFEFADDLGPIKIVQIYDPKSGLKAVVAIDNVARGPSIGPLISSAAAPGCATIRSRKSSAAPSIRSRHDRLESAKTP